MSRWSFIAGPGRAALCSLLTLLGLWACRSAPETRLDAAVAASRGAQPSPAVAADVPALTISNLATGMFALNALRATSISTAAQLERQTDASTWMPESEIDGADGYRILEACPGSADQAPKCRALAAGATLVPVAWSGQRCGAQCAAACPADGFRAGSFRLVVSDCENPRLRYEGPTFVLPQSAAMTARWQAASAERVSIARIDGKDSQDPLSAGVPGRLAGFALLSHDAHPLGSPAQAELAAWLRQDGFDDKVVRRCARGVSVGLVAWAQLPNGAQDKTELALDFGCNALIMVREQGGQRRQSASFFDASRAQILSLVRNALPGDQDITRLK